MNKVNLDTHKTYFPFILVGLSILLAAAFAAWYPGLNERSGDSSVKPSVISESRITVTHDQYVALVSPILSDYLVDQDANRAYTRLAEITVPVEDLSTHLELVIIFGKFQATETAEATARYQSLKQKISWLP